MELARDLPLEELVTHVLPLERYAEALAMLAVAPAGAGRSEAAGAGAGRSEAAGAGAGRSEAAGPGRSETAGYSAMKVLLAADEGLAP
ncbi:hypothetical protein ACFQ0M_01845 [Kitasatospora aburaviensis]